MRRNITDYTYLLGFVLYIVVGTAVSLVILPFLLLAILVKRLYLLASSHFQNICSELKEKREIKKESISSEKKIRKLKKEERCFIKEIRKRKKKIYKYECAVIKAREHKERLEKLFKDTDSVRGEIMLLEEAIEQNYADLQYFEEVLEEVTREIARIESDPENFSREMCANDLGTHPDRG